MPKKTDQRPRTLAEIDPHAEIRFDVWGVMASHPNITSSAMRVIAMWSHGDVLLSHLVSVFLDGSFGVVADMLSNLRSARMSAIRSTARQRLSREDRKLFNSCLDAYEGLKRYTRDMYAHHLWVDSPKGPEDALLLLEARHLVRKKADAVEGAHDMAKAVGIDQDTLDSLASAFTHRDIPANLESAEIDVDFGFLSSGLDRSHVMLIYSDEVTADFLVSRKAVEMIRTLHLVMSPDPSVDPQERDQLLHQLDSLRNTLTELKEMRGSRDSR